MLFSFGDSWTEGVGGDLTEEFKTNSSEDRTKIRQNYCWPKYLSDLLNIDFKNFGIGGCSNKIIFEAVCNCVENNTIKSSDFVVIMWSSSLRDSVPFFPENNPWHLWGERYKNKEHLYQILFKSDETKNKSYNRIKKDYMNFYISNIYSQQYYNFINQNYIIYIQFLFEKLGIPYLFCDAFDTMISKNVVLEFDKTKFINKNRYWEFQNKTVKDFLCDTKRNDVWEDDKLWDSETIGKHPNKNGYKLIADEFFKFIVENNLLITEKRMDYPIL